jgi:arylsulfatase A-like enzyme
LPTFADIAGVRVQDGNVDGVSFSPTLEKQSRIEREAIYWHYPHYHTLGIGPSGAVRQGKYKLIEWFEKSIDNPQNDGALELFDLETDPAERHNIAPLLPDKAALLYKKLKAWRKRVGAQEMAKNPNYDPPRASQQE